MGLFKGMKDLKGLSDDRGGMPSIKGAFQDIGKLADDRGEREILKSGTPAEAVVKGFPTPIQGDKFAMQILVEVHLEGRDPYDVEYVFPSARMQAGLGVGMKVPVKVDPADPTRIAVQWDIYKASIAAQGGDMAAVTAGLQSTYSGTADAAMRQAMAGGAGAAPAAEDPTEKLKKLGELHASGVLSDEEFEAKKAELLKQI